MSIPKIDYPTYDIKMPSDNRIITVRPFSVKEEKLLLMAIEAKNMDDVIKTVKQVINNCVVKGDVNVDRLPFFDIDYLFIFLRAKSIGESVEVTLTVMTVVAAVVDTEHPTELNVGVETVPATRITTGSPKIVGNPCPGPVEAPPPPRMFPKL